MSWTYKSLYRYIYISICSKFHTLSPYIKWLESKSTLVRSEYDFNWKIFKLILMMTEVSVVKLPWGDCQWTSLIISQNWLQFGSGNGLALSGNITLANIDPNQCHHMVLAAMIWLCRVRVSVCTNDVKFKYIPIFLHSNSAFTGLTHLPLVPHICISELGQHWFRQWLVAY